MRSRPSFPPFATVVLLLFLPMVAVLFAGCSSGGGGASTAASGGRATLAVTLSSPGPSGGGALSGVAAEAYDPGFSPLGRLPGHPGRIAHLYMDVRSISLLPAEEPAESGDLEGELDDRHGPGPEEGGEMAPLTLVPAVPTRIDLLALGTGTQMARFLDRFASIPAGTYDKIRVRYDNVQVVLEGPGGGDEEALSFHPTARSRFDLHFREGRELVIPAASDTTQADGWVRFFRVRVDLVGLKLRIVDGDGGRWRSGEGKVVLRPQVFAAFEPPVLYSVAGTAHDVSATSPAPSPAGSLQVSFGDGPGYPKVVPVAWGSGTSWSMSDDVLGASPWIVDVSPTAGAFALRDRALVEAVGTFDAAKVLHASGIVFTFPDEAGGTVDNGWRPDNTFRLKGWTANFPSLSPPTGPFPVFPAPDRLTARYDNAAAPHAALDDLAVRDNAFVPRARGYARPSGAGLDAFWISFGP